MKLTNISAALGTAVAVAIIAASCTRKSGKEVAQENQNFSNKTLVQVYDATINSTSTQVFIDGNAVTGTALAYGAVFPSSAYAFQVDPGLRAFNIRNTTAGTTQAPITFSENLDGNKNYTIFMYDTMTTAKQITVENKIVIPSDTTARVKFGNFAWSRTGAAPNVDVFSKLRGENVFSNIAPTQVTEYIPYAAAITDSLIVRQAGTAIALDTATFNFTRKRSYTLVYRGRAGYNEAGGATFPRILSSFVNY
jgi:hypothetical protein